VGGDGYGGRGTAQHYMSVVVNAIPWPLYPPERIQVSIFVQETARTSGAIGTVAENLASNGAECGSQNQSQCLALPGFQPHIIQSEA